MKIFFGEADPEQYPGINTDELFRDPDTRQYYFYMMESDEEGCVRIFDTCNRMVPFDITQIESLSEAVYVLQEIELMKATVAEEMAENIETIVKTTHDYTGVRVLV